MAAVGPDAAARGGFEEPGVQEPREQKLRVQVGGDHPGFEQAPVFGNHAVRLPVLYADLPYRGVGFDLGALFPRESCHGLGDGAHAALRVAPGAGASVHLTECVVQQDVGRSGLVGVDEVADDAFEAEYAFQGIGLEPAIQVVSQ